MARRTGTILLYNGSFGSIEPDDGGEPVLLLDVAVEATGIAAAAGLRVVFDAIETPLGLSATHLEYIQ